jgi:hypothetical protein
VQWTALESDRPTPAGEGRPRFPIMDAAKWQRAVRERRCWVCGQPLGARMTFVIGPMCLVNRTTAEPPCHHDCATFAARACPFLTQPRMRRMPVLEGAIAPPGIPLERNPGVVCVATTKGFYIIDTDHGPLIKLGRIEEVLWFAEGATADRATVKDALDRGLPALRELAVADGMVAVRELNRLIVAAHTYLPRT